MVAPKPLPNPPVVEQNPPPVAGAPNAELAPGAAPNALLVLGAPNAFGLEPTAVFPKMPPLVAVAAGCDPKPPNPPADGVVFVAPKADDPNPPPVDGAPNADGCGVPNPPVAPNAELVAG